MEPVVTTFTPVSAIAGGALIGLAAAVLLLANGRIMGISGILGGLYAERGEGLAWRACFLAGLLAGAWLVLALLDPAQPVAIEASWPLLAAGGLLVGIGTRVGGGCTSGHGVCGIARGSPRSLAATAVFFVAALATVFVLRHLLGAS